MKSITLNGIEVKIGSIVRFVDDTNLYIDDFDIKKPILYAFYTVRDIVDGAVMKNFLLEEIINEKCLKNGTVEQSFRVSRFIAVPPQKETIKEKRKVKIDIKIETPVIERVETVRVLD